MIETDFAELVDEHGGIGERRRVKQSRSRVVLPLPRKPVMTLTGMDAV